jgi:hypothetical protein
MLESGPDANAPDRGREEARCSTWRSWQRPGGCNSCARCPCELARRELPTDLATRAAPATIGRAVRPHARPSARSRGRAPPAATPGAAAPEPRLQQPFHAGEGGVRLAGVLEGGRLVAAARADAERQPRAAARNKVGIASARRATKDTSGRVRRSRAEAARPQAQPPRNWS